MEGERFYIDGELDAAYAYRLGERTTALVQMLFAENVFRDAGVSNLSAFEIHLTAGVRVETLGGSLAFGITENMFNYDDTPDIGLHLSYALRLPVAPQP